MLTTSFDHSIRRNQHCINLRSHLGSAASFVLNQLQKYNIRDSIGVKLKYNWTTSSYVRILFCFDGCYFMVWPIAFLPKESPRAGVVSVGPLVIDAIVVTVSLAWAWPPVDERAQGVWPSVVSPARRTPTPSLGEEGVETTDGLAGVAAGRRKTSRAIVRGETTLQVSIEFIYPQNIFWPCSVV